MSNRLSTRTVSTVGVLLGVLLFCVVGISGSVSEFVPTLEWWTLDEINARETNQVLAPFDLNTSDSQHHILGEFVTNYRVSWSPAIDSTRGLLYVTEASSSNFDNSGGSIAVIDLKTLTFLRRMTIQSGTERATPDAVAVDPTSNRLFVSVANVFQQNKLWIADATSGSVLNTIPFDQYVAATPYSAATNRLYGWWGGVWGDFIAAFNLANPQSPVDPILPTPPNSGYLLVNEASKLMYVNTQPNMDFFPVPDTIFADSQVLAVDIDPASPSFKQVVWTGSGSSTLRRGYLHPALDSVRQRLYVPDVKAHTLRVFDVRRGPTLHQELPSIQLELQRSESQETVLDQFEAPEYKDLATRWSVFPEVDPMTGLIYAVVSSELRGTDNATMCCENSYILTIRPDVGVVARASLPQGLFNPPFIKLDPETRRIVVGSAESNRLVFLEDQRSSSLATPTGGAPVMVTAPEATLTFSSVTTAGTTTIEPRSIAGVDVNLPSQFTIDGGLLYQVSTTAAIAGPIALCFSAAHMDDPAGFDALHVLHGENGSWVDRTISRNFETRTICAQTTSLSPFVIAKLTSPAYAPRLLYSVDRAFKSGSTAPIKVQVLDWAGTNVSAAGLSLHTVSLRRTGSDNAQEIQDAGNANPDSGFRYDASLAGYIFNLSTRGLAPGTYALTADVADRGHFVQLPFSVR